MQGHWEVVAMLLGARADLNKVDDGGHTALDEACKHGHGRVIKLLVARGARLGFSGVKVRTPQPLTLDHLP